MIELVKSGDVEYRDINLEPDRLAAFGSDVEDIRKKLHALDGDDLLIGADVVTAIYKRLPGYKWLGHFMSFAPVRPFVHMGYNVLAYFLYGWNRRKGHW